MGTSSYRKTLGTALCVFFGVITFGNVFQLISNKFNLYNPVGTPIIWIVYNVLCCVVMAYFATKKDMHSPLYGRIGAGIMTLIFAIVTINLFLSFFEINIFNNIGQNFGIAVSSIELAAATLLFFSLKTWPPVKISAFLYWIPNLCASFYFAKIKEASELAITTSDYTILERIFNATEICAYLSLTLSILTIILTIVWMNKKPMAPHTQSNIIDII